MCELAVLMAPAWRRVGSHARGVYLPARSGVGQGVRQLVRQRARNSSLRDLLLQASSAFRS